MARTKKQKAARFAKNKKLKKLALDSTPWEELSKNIRGKFKSKIETQEEQKNINQLLVPDDCVNEKNNDKLNSQESNNDQLIDVLSKDLNKPQHKKKQKIKTEAPFESIHVKVEHDSKNDISIKNSFLENNDIESPNTNGQESLPDVKQLSKWQKRKLKRQRKEMSDLSSPISAKNFLENNSSESPNTNGQESLPDVKKLLQWQKKKLKWRRKEMSNLSSPISAEKLGAAFQPKTKKHCGRKKMERLQLYEKKRLERRKELGIMQLPKNIENRLLRIRKALKRKNLPPEEMKTIMREERGKAQDEFRKTQLTQICFNCRKPGHYVAVCPLNEDSKSTSICLKCGSTDHKYNVCKHEIAGFPFANCFICKGLGHISRECPDNEHGIYPKGGKCNLCDSVNHLSKDCPTNSKNKKKPSSITLHTIDNGTSIDDEVMYIEQSTKNIKSEKPKVVTF